MSIIKAQISKGTRDFLPSEVFRRNYIFENIKSIFELFGYFPIETPSFELLQTLTGKYGEEGDRLIFKILNSGDFLAKVDDKLLEERQSAAIIKDISKKGLRYDLTVPFARFVVQHQNELIFPFKRYQIQQVWRADRPQKGRYQEFYQCDVDVIGSDSLMYEAELIQIYDQVFDKLNLEVEIIINNRKVLAGIAEVAGIEDRFTEMTVAIDKLDKIGEQGVITEMEKNGIGKEPAEKVLSSLKIDNLNEIERLFAQSETGLKGIEELKSVFAFLGDNTLKNKVVFDVSLARGLNYYTGCIFEVKACTGNIGSIGGGGRYAELTEVFGRSGMSGVGVSFGAERIYDLMKEQDLFPEDLNAGTQLLFVSFDSASHNYAFNTASKLRLAGISVDVYPEAAKMKKQMKFANATKVPFVAVIGDEEMQSGNITLKNMGTGEQQKLTLEEIKTFLLS